RQRFRPWPSRLRDQARNCRSSEQKFHARCAACSRASNARCFVPGRPRIPADWQLLAAQPAAAVQSAQATPNADPKINEKLVSSVLGTVAQFVLPYDLAVN